jgi:hypothetical protein
MKKAVVTRESRSTLCVAVRDVVRAHKWASVMLGGVAIQYCAIIAVCCTWSSFPGSDALRAKIAYICL